MPNTASPDTATSDTVVRLSNVTKAFEHTERSGLFRRERRLVNALTEVSFEVRAGEFVAYAGPNGAGKSTTFRLLCGMLAPQSGEIAVFGRDPGAARIPNMQKTGLMFASRSELWWDHPVRSSFLWKKKVWGIPDDTYAHMIALVSELLGLDSLMERFVRELSFGQRMRANLGLTLLHDPALLLLDEPTLGLDVLAKRQMIAFLRHINREQGTTIIVTSHDMDDLTEMARRIILIQQGQLAFDGDYQQLMHMTGDKHRLRFRMDGPPPALPGATLASAEDDGLMTFEYDAGTGGVQALLRAVADLPGVSDIETGRAPIEAVIAELYEGWSK